MDDDVGQFAYLLRSALADIGKLRTSILCGDIPSNTSATASPSTAFQSQSQAHPILTSFQRSRDAAQTQRPNIAHRQSQRQSQRDRSHSRRTLVVDESSTDSSPNESQSRSRRHRPQSHSHSQSSQSMLIERRNEALVLWCCAWLLLCGTE